MVSPLWHGPPGAPDAPAASPYFFGRDAGGTIPFNR